MIRFLHIRSLAVIDSLSVEFAPGLNVITGETGAGKSVVASAIDLLVGGRASGELVRTGCELASVQALLETVDNKELVVRREVTAAGRSRAFLDDVLVTLNSLRQTMAALIDLHGQHDHQLLLDPAEHLAVVDRFGQLDEALATVGRAWDEWMRSRRAVDALALDERERELKLESARFQLAEIERVQPEAGEDERLAEERTILRHADRLVTLASEAYRELYEADHSALGRLSVVWRRLDDLASLDPRFGEYRSLAETTMPALEDLAMTLRRYCSSIEASADRLQAVEDRLSALERLKRRYGPSLADVLARARSLRETIETLEASEERRSALEHALRDAERQYLEAARDLSQRRREVARRLTGLLERDSRALAMPDARFDFAIRSSAEDPDRWGRTGYDRGELLVSVNAGEDLRPLARVASGGELSRIMLALKSLATVEPSGKTLVFDEVDSGVSGRVADIVGRKLKELAQRYQVICITHLPQVAAHGSVHFRVDKHTDGSRTIVTMTRLGESDRIDELARLLAGREVTRSARATARDMLALAAKGESK